ncbi:PD-(D/E)XK nuclease-like domain-containing protein [Nocardioides KLBMP 9356]|uniref:PD-(D/E)XK nuclease-like domain-containing protein n=1 Tax=Nocardioides potassii TaxID=2911371 RepID=A0ABS9HA02_9ACTN|nr:PD-(D/E)XK nuclease-like domain-containing protein [Nocardioides potassii]MCF6376926.1 PD-(D/E)XK nuclease-like domain-containing protein [Nocardioides potassii]
MNVDNITAPGGFTSGVSDEAYHADPIPGGSLSSTFARLLTDNVPAKAYELRRNRKPTKSMNLGKAAHAHALGAGPLLIVWQHDGRTKDGKAERAEYADMLATEAAVAVSEAERDQIIGMATALRESSIVAKILDESEAEVSGFWQEDGVWCRARYDLLGERAAWDYKTCTDASRRGFSKAMANYGYHQQAEFYRRGLQALGHPAARTPLRFICQEVTAPYLVQIHTPDDLSIEVAKELNDRAIRIYAESMSTGLWAGFDGMHAEPTPLPGYYFFDRDDVLSESWRVPSEEITV